MPRILRMLRGVAPAEYGRFVELFELHVRETYQQLAQASNEEVIRMQGRALALNGMLQMLKEAKNG